MADVGGIASERLQSFVERLERLEEEKAALSEDIKRGLLQKPNLAALISKLCAKLCASGK